MKKLFYSAITLSLFFVCVITTSSASVHTQLNQILNEIKNNKEIYLVPNSQDVEGLGLSEGTLSETVLPPYIMAPRRQTDSLVRQMYKLLPIEIQNKTAFVIADRLVQNPEAYLPYLKSKKNIVIVGSFYGIGTVSSLRDDEWEVINEQHSLELYKLEKSLQIAKALSLKIIDVVYGMGDSNSELSEITKKKLQYRFNIILQSYGVPRKQLAWGADEMISVAFAKQLPHKTIWVKFSNPKAVQFMDGLKTADVLFEQKMKELGLIIVKDKAKANILAFIFTRRNNGSIDDFQENDLEQRASDKSFSRQIEALTPEQRAKTVVIDARLFNGAWDDHCVPQQCDFLAFGSWGTFANKIGTTLALAKILQFQNSKKLQERLFLEAVYHDVYFNGYEVQRLQGQKLLERLGIDFLHFDGYKDPESTAIVFNTLNSFANAAIKEHFKNGTCMQGREIRATPQFWRTFESEVHLWPIEKGEEIVTGLYRMDLPPETFNPSWGITSIISAN